MQEALHQELTETAKSNQRSISEEIERRLNEWGRFRSTELVRAIRQAGFQIVRDAGGKVTSYIASFPPRLTEFWLLRFFVAPENVDKSSTEIMVERAVENAVARALEKAGLLGRKGAA